MRVKRTAAASSWDPPRRRRRGRLGQASILMTFFVALMGAAWYGLETGMIGEPPPPEAVAEAAAGIVMTNAEVTLQAKAAKEALEAAGQ